MLLSKLKTQIENANSLGRTNLNAKGVTTDGTETTYQIMNKIATIPSNSADGQENAPNPLEYVNSLYNSFKQVTFPTDYELKLNVPRITTLFGIVYEAKGIKRLTLKGNESGNKVSFDSMCRGCKDIEILDLTEFNAKPSTVNLAFYQATNLKEILGEVDLSECTNTTNAFQGCSSLEEIRTKANTIIVSISFTSSYNLSFSSVQSIFDGLSTVETAQTLTLHSSQKVLQSQIDSANAKGWTVVGGTVVQEAW